jgi:hypothetical protein
MRVDFSSPQSVREALSAKDAEIERLRAVIRCEQESGRCVMIHDPDRTPCTRRTCHFMGVVYPKLAVG